MKRLNVLSKLALSTSFGALAIAAAPVFAQATGGEPSATNAQPGGGQAVDSDTARSGTVADQENGAVDDIVVTGVRASLDRAIAIKRDSPGVVDAISAEDIGKFPDTNLAESLQRITGVSIDRTNGEGSRVTAEHVAWKLVEQDDRRQRGPGIGEEARRRKPALLRPKLLESLPDLGIERVVRIPPLLRLKSEPEVDDLVRPIAQAAVPPTVRPSISSVG